MEKLAKIRNTAFREQFSMEKDAFIREFFAARKAGKAASKAEKSLKNFELWGDASKRSKLINGSVDDTKAFIQNMRGEQEAQLLAMHGGNKGQKYMTLDEHSAIMDNAMETAAKAAVESDMAAYKAGRNTGVLAAGGTALAGVGAFTYYKNKNRQ